MTRLFCVKSSLACAPGEVPLIVLFFSMLREFYERGYLASIKSPEFRSNRLADLFDGNHLTPFPPQPPCSLGFDQTIALDDRVFWDTDFVLSFLRGDPRLRPPPSPPRMASFFDIGRFYTSRFRPISRPGPHSLDGISPNEPDNAPTSFLSFSQNRFRHSPHESSLMPVLNPERLPSAGVTCSIAARSPSIWWRQSTSWDTDSLFLS